MFAEGKLHSRGNIHPHFPRTQSISGFKKARARNLLPPPQSSPRLADLGLPPPPCLSQVSQVAQTHCINCTSLHQTPRMSQENIQVSAAKFGTLTPYLLLLIFQNLSALKFFLPCAFCRSHIGEQSPVVTKVFLHLLNLGNEIRVDVAGERSGFCQFRIITSFFAQERGIKRGSVGDGINTKLSEANQYP